MTFTILLYEYEFELMISERITILNYLYEFVNSQFESEVIEVIYGYSYYKSMDSFDPLLL